MSRIAAHEGSRMVWAGGGRCELCVWCKKALMKNYPRPLSFSRGGPLTKFFRPFDSCWCTIILDYHKITITRLPLSLDGNKLKESMQSLSG